jgi:hypothetical protein
MGARARTTAPNSGFQNIIVRHQRSGREVGAQFLLAAGRRQKLVSGSIT